MGRGRAPCCDKSQVKRGPWSPSEDLKLINFIRHHGHDNWRALPKLAGLVRCGKSCRLRWINYLRPDVKRGNFTKEEEETVIKLHRSLGNKWSKIASQLPGRTDNEIKNVWNTHLKKKLSAFDSTSGSKGDEESKRESSVMSSLSSSSSLSPSPSPSSSFAACRDREGDVMEIAPGNKELLTGAHNKPDVSTGAHNKPLSSLSHGSNESNISNEIGGSAKDGEEKVDSLSSPLEEVNKPETVPPSEVLDIPFEFDTDFWNILDNLGTSLPLQVTDQIDQFLEGDTYRDNQLRDQDIGAETENKKWLRHLENELGLVQLPPMEEDDPRHPKDASQPPN